MERKTFFAEVIIPLSLPKTLTYRVPFEMNDFILVGQRVVVPLGKKKLYSALVRRIHEEAPTDYQAKYIDSIIDEFPIVNEVQFKLWEWISKYYLCNLGDVMTAALPGSFKLASETKVVLRDDWDRDDSVLDDKEFLIVEALEIQGVLTLMDIAEIAEQKNVLSLIKNLIKKKVVITEEELRQLFKPLIKDFVRLNPSLHDDDKLGEVLDQLQSRAKKQFELLMHFLKEDPEVPFSEKAINRLHLQKVSGVQSSVVKKLVEKDIFEIESREVGRIEEYKDQLLEEKELSPAQESSYKQIKSQWKTKDVVLLHGVTGSGKTEIYVRLIKEALDRGEQVLYLLPEIALTTQLINRLKKYFGDLIGVYHSRFNQNERVEIWNSVLENNPDKQQIIIGARSSVFLPYSNLGLVIVDEEHENSFKQFDPAPRYHARDISIVLATFHKAKVLMGSATPSIESYWSAEKGRFGLVELKERFGDIKLPEIQCADLSKEYKTKSMKGIFSSLLYEEINQALENDRQIILFQNRRGYAPYWQCTTCSHVPECKKCDVSLTYHKFSHQLKCHYCGYSQTPPSTCSSCGSSEIKMQGFGTEKIAEEINQHFPNARVQRMDLDTTRSKHAYQKIISEFEEKAIDILVGTQMVTKGLDFDNVALVGVLNADQMIHFPDFRAFERAFQLMTQVAGRAGRKKRRGKVIIQSFSPDHWVLQKVMANDFDGLYRQEVLERRNFLYPPFYRLIKLTLKHKDPRVIEAVSHSLANSLRARLGDRVLGPEIPYVSRINLLYLRNIMIKIEREASPSKSKDIINQHILDVKSHPDFKSVRVVIDVDPV